MRYVYVALGIFALGYGLLWCKYAALWGAFAAPASGLQ